MDLKNEIQSHGGNATTMFASAVKQENLLLFDRFKMSLYKDPEWRSSLLSSTDANFKRLDISDKITPRFHTSNDLQRDSSLIFIAQLRYLRNEALEFLKEKFKLGRKFKCADHEIQWILTVPAIWSDGAKARMVEWAKEAGLITSQTLNQLKLVYEPDCASLSIQHALLRSAANQDENKMDGSANVPTKIQPHRPRVDIDCAFCVGDKYILLDIGGGTCDVACHKICGKFAIEEILHPSGGPWGGTQIDQQFEQLLATLFTKEWMDEFKRTKMAMYQQLMSNFIEDSKGTFLEIERTKNNVNYHAVTLPRNFSTFIIQKYEDMYAQIHSDYDYESGVKVSNEFIGQRSFEIYQKNEFCLCLKKKMILKKKCQKIYIWLEQDAYTVSLCLTHEIWTDMFDSVAVPIIKHCRQILNKQEMEDTKYIFLVGGMANSTYIQRRIRSEFSKNTSIKCIVPHLPQLCVVDGAARHGISPNFMKVRRLPKTYGIAANRKRDTLDLKLFPPAFLEANSYYCEIRKQERVSNCFYAFAYKSRAIRCDEKPIVRSFSKHRGNQEVCQVVIYESDDENPQSTHSTEAREIGKFEVEFDNLSKVKKIIVEFSYTDTTLKVYAYPEGQPEKKQQILIKYQ